MGLYGDDYLGTYWISPSEANHVLWHYDGGGYEPGQFFAALLNAIARADSLNRIRLGTVFPGYVAACNIAEDREDWVAVLTDIAAGERTPPVPYEQW
jgi:hypothetical protein